MEPLDSYNLMKTLFIESCPSLVPQADQIITGSTEVLRASNKDKYICKGLELCWHAHSIG